MNPEPVHCACETCQHWLHKGPGPDGTEWGNCRRFPPTRVDAGVAAFPSTPADLWCGEWKQLMTLSIVRPERELKLQSVAQEATWDGILEAEKKAALGVHNNTGLADTVKSENATTGTTTPGLTKIKPPGPEPTMPPPPKKNFRTAAEQFPEGTK